jgi:hypothetical protein
MVSSTMTQQNFTSAYLLLHKTTSNNQRHREFYEKLYQAGILFSSYYQTGTFRVDIDDHGVTGQMIKFIVELDQGTVEYHWLKSEFEKKTLDEIADNAVSQRAHTILREPTKIKLAAETFAGDRYYQAIVTQQHIAFKSGTGASQESHVNINRDYFSKLQEDQIGVFVRKITRTYSKSSKRVKSVADDSDTIRSQGFGSVRDHGFDKNGRKSRRSTIYSQGENDLSGSNEKKEALMKRAIDAIYGAKGQNCFFYRPSGTNTMKRHARDKGMTTSKSELFKIFADIATQSLEKQGFFGFLLRTFIFRPDYMEALYQLINKINNLVNDPKFDADSEGENREISVIEKQMQQVELKIAPPSHRI